jgi:NAD(P)-dependent dehydrogenase (short-subunit alcohol dehydrogenase family)
VVHTGTSRGFGAQIAKEALAQGHQVVATARNPDTVTAAFPSAAALLADPLDVTNAAEAASAATAAVDHFGRIDVLVTIVEPGYFRTDFLDSSSLRTETTVIDDYAPTAGVMRQTALERNDNQPGDLAKAAAAIVELAAVADPARSGLGGPGRGQAAARPARAHHLEDPVGLHRPRHPQPLAAAAATRSSARMITIYGWSTGRRWT